ncbi:hypothetical protein [Noviherbaspirillum massiliense]|nr:hypothetical protein [Noviherbaspirillum massiliense]
MAEQYLRLVAKVSNFRVPAGDYHHTAYAITSERRPMLDFPCI